MGQGGWYFSKRRPNSGKARNSQVEKFFQDRTNAVIREGIQNSLDAGLSGEGVGAKSINVVMS